MPPGERRPVRIGTDDTAHWQRLEGLEGLEGREVCPPFGDDTEQVCLQRLAPGQTVWAASAESAELLMLDGSVVMAGDTLQAWQLDTPASYRGVRPVERPPDRHR